jgi:hypothetical protein
MNYAIMHEKGGIAPLFHMLFPPEMEKILATGSRIMVQVLPS